MRKSNNKSTGSKRKKQAKSSLLEKLDKSSLVKDLDPKELEKIRGGNKNQPQHGIIG
jgi:hypothetical protein